MRKLTPKPRNILTQIYVLYSIENIIQQNKHIHLPL